MRRPGLLALAALLGAACAPAAPPAPAPAPAAEAALPRDVHWFRNAAEQRAVYLQTYRAAGARVRELAAGRAPGSWAVVLDADETVLDNSLYQKERALLGLGFTPETWNAWVRRAAAPALPGAPEFIALVDSLGGRVAIVTNRDEEVCPETRENLRRLRIEVDVVLCKQPGVSDKNPRFRAVAGGTAAAGMGPAEVLVWVGDNIQDFPGLSQEVRVAPPEALARFGRTFFVLPNPMYGSWERNPPQ